jgi:gliding motility-associated-like protein
MVNKDGCKKADTVTIELKKKPAPDLGPDRNICPGEELILDPAVTGTIFKWQDGSRTPSYKVTTAGRYAIEVENECGVGTDEVVITNGSCKLLVPNAFTPGKAANKLFRLSNGFGLKDFSLQVFNRWGQQVYKSTNASEGWDGKYKGVDQPSGMYVYILSYSDEVAGKTTQKGTVTLIR